MAPGPLSQTRASEDAAIPLLHNDVNPTACDTGIASPVPDEPAAASRVTGYAFMVLSAFFHALMSFFIRVAESSYGYPSVSCIIVRACTSISLSLIYLGVHRLFHTLSLPAKHFALLSLRGLFGAATGVCTFYSLQYLPVGIAITILYASPAITSVLAAIVLRDPFTLSQFVTLVINFTGVTLTSRGSYTDHAIANQFVLIGVAYAFGAAFCASAVFILVRLMGLRVHFILGCLFYGVGCVLLACVLGTRADVAAILHNHKGTLYATLSGFAGFGSQTMLTRALQIIHPGPAAVVRSLNVPISFTLGLVFLSEKPSLVSALGISLVLVSIASVAWQKRRIQQLPNAVVTDDSE